MSRGSEAANRLCQPWFSKVSVMVFSLVIFLIEASRESVGP
ncbi:conserved hypothetical protein [delta proteobacterium NaphS2]|nr:conserved hypothetical protein [delta proteobacterium NaphS2]